LVWSLPCWFSQFECGGYMSSFAKVAEISAQADIYKGLRRYPQVLSRVCVQGFCWIEPCMTGEAAS
jgi:hypothetical protein